jgi:CO dehydrogenase nickel-insertion accessory protein CooC1
MILLSCVAALELRSEGCACSSLQIQVELLGEIFQKFNNSACVDTPDIGSNHLGTPP